MAPDFIGTLPGWITAASTTTGVAAIIIAFFRRGVSLKGLQNADSADIRDHYAQEVEALRSKLNGQEGHFHNLEKHWREMIAASDRRHQECEDARQELRGELDKMHTAIRGLRDQLLAQSTDRVLILEGTPAAEKAPHSVAAAKRIKENGEGGK
jgi:septal ring factor EnvC (AmiA/AmiB activator)